MLVAYLLIVHRVRNTKMQTMKESKASKRVKDFRRIESQKEGGKSAKKLKKTPNMKSKVTRMCAVLVSSFVICWMPFHAMHLAKLNIIPFPYDKVSLALTFEGRF